MPGAQRGTSAGGRAADSQGRRGQEGGDDRGLARGFRGIPRLLLSRLQVGIGLIDPLLGLCLGKAGLLGDDPRQIGAVASIELRVCQPGGEDASDRRFEIRA